MATVAKVAISGAQITPTIPLPEKHTAAHAALFTRELLCNIVARLPFQDVLAATGVCREWRAAIVGDPNIRENLFLKPAKVRLVLAHKKYMLETETLIPLNECSIVGAVLPLLASVFDRVYFAPGNYIFQAGVGTKNPLKRRKFRRHKTTPAFEVANHFWRDMFITQPPCSNVHVSISICRGLGVRYIGDKLHDIDLQRADGIKLGDLYDIFRSHLEGDYNQFFIVLTVRDWIAAEYVVDKFRDRFRCEVHNGEVQRPAPSTACDDYVDFDSGDDGSDHDLSSMDDDNSDDDYSSDDDSDRY